MAPYTSPEGVAGYLNPLAHDAFQVPRSSIPLVSTANALVQVVPDAISALRSLRADFGVPAGTSLPMALLCTDSSVAASAVEGNNQGQSLPGYMTGRVVIVLSAEYSGEVCRMAKVSQIEVHPFDTHTHVRVIPRQKHSLTLHSRA